MVAAIRAIFTQPTGSGVREHVDVVADMLAEKFPSVAELLRDAAGDTTEFADFPEAECRHDTTQEVIGSPNLETA